MEKLLDQDMSEGRIYNGGRGTAVIGPRLKTIINVSSRTLLIHEEYAGADRVYCLPGEVILLIKSAGTMEETSKFSRWMVSSCVKLPVLFERFREHFRYTGIYFDAPEGGQRFMTMDEWKDYYGDLHKKEHIGSMFAYNYSYLLSAALVYLWGNI